MEINDRPHFQKSWNLERSWNWISDDSQLSARHCLLLGHHSALNALKTNDNLFVSDMSKVDLKVVLLGMEFSGKTSLVERYLHDRFQGDIPYQNTIGAAYGAKRMTVLGKHLTVGIWDTAGSERYEAMSRFYYRGASAAVVCYDLTDETSFEKARFWVNELRKNEENCRIYLCGTKKDLIDDGLRPRKVNAKIASNYAVAIEAKLFETSSKTGEYVPELFTIVAQDFVNSPIVKQMEDSLRLEETSHSAKQTSCCLFSR